MMLGAGGEGTGLMPSSEVWEHQHPGRMMPQPPTGDGWAVLGAGGRQQSPSRACVSRGSSTRPVRPQSRSPQTPSPQSTSQRRLRGVLG